ncbi:MAG: HAD family hydrolase [Limnothrix sp.]|uniref:HAD family hydrolase n=1 Tax=unclassified Limnothrix TaxID=2632864 RepID=UPI001680CFCE|nr:MULTISPECIES: HAD family hydrolase [unclassified Limnothrix]MBD2161162.1 HAD family hydrolase [Limnothrix sp. FACHB-1083]MBD2192475.1 HAD family hydrolase [Limnothrix sp. FACHB-1088]MEB3118452.1 HAD family hydrolase [Limnothrix sp.]
MRLITDFDGPIADVSERYYQVYQYCLREIARSGQEIHRLSKREFWNLKRAQVKEAEIGVRSGLDGTQADQFAQLRRDTVHRMEYMSLDQPVPGAIQALERAQDMGWELVVMTMRRVRELDEALERCGLARFFTPDRRYCLPNDYVKTRDVEDKPKLMAKAMGELPPAALTWMVGDTEADIAAARSAQIPIVGVLSGIRDRDRLEGYEPDAIAPNLAGAIDYIIAKTNRATKTTLPREGSLPRTGS